MAFEDVGHAVTASWPAHSTRRESWRQGIRGGSREDRTLDHVDAAIPPQIGSLDYHATPQLSARLERAVLEVNRTDAQAGSQSRALARFMVRTESVASSKIERIQASTADYARALAGSRANASAVSMVAASAALHDLVEKAGANPALRLEDILAAHRDLMRDDLQEAEYAGRLRDMQNWIGGSDHSPRNALYVPPPPDLVEPLMRDLVGYANRDDIPILVQASVAHAQFESVHPFTDGNGRIGRALISAVLRRRGVARNVIIPLASGILAVREQYFAALTAYRSGDVEPIVSIVARSASAAAREASTSIRRLAVLPDEWRRTLRPRAGSAVAILIEALVENPVMAADEIVAATGGNTTAAYNAIGRLVDADVIEEITGRKRDRVWAATDALGELDDLDLRIRAAMVHERP